MYRHVPDCTDCKAMANLTWYQLGGETDNCLSYSCPPPLCQMSPIICSHRGALLAGSYMTVVILVMLVIGDIVSEEVT